MNQRIPLAFITSLGAAITISLAGPAASAVAAPAPFGNPAVASALPAPGQFGSMLADRLLANLESMKDEINLTPAQQFQLGNCLTQTKTLRTAAQGAAAIMKQTIDAELAKPQPDLALIAATSDAMQAQMIAARQAVRAEWLTLYAMLSPEQQTIVGARLEKAWLRLESVFELLQRLAPAQH